MCIGAVERKNFVLLEAEVHTFTEDISSSEDSEDERVWDVLQERRNLLRSNRRITEGNVVDLTYESSPEHSPYESAASNDDEDSYVEDADIETSSFVSSLSSSTPTVYLRDVGITEQDDDDEMDSEEVKMEDSQEEEKLSAQQEDGHMEEDAQEEEDVNEDAQEDENEDNDEEMKKTIRGEIMSFLRAARNFVFPLSPEESKQSLNNNSSSPSLVDDNVNDVATTNLAPSRKRNASDTTTTTNEDFPSSSRPEGAKVQRTH